MSRKYQIINDKNEFATRKNFASEITFTNNQNFAYIFTLEEAEQIKEILSKENKNIKIVDWKTYKI